jgi:2-oxoglutarate dehydrogenase E1 component
LLLQHGYEGQGPEHSSARLERFLHLCAEDNIQVCQPTTAAKYFHILRRQALRPWRKPLDVMTPKGLLRAEPACSPLSALATGRFHPVLPMPHDTRKPAAERVLGCTGKIAHELRAYCNEKGLDRLAILTLEQLSPFPDLELKAALEPYGGRAEIVWLQEEPANMAAESFVHRRPQDLAGNRHVTAVHRSPSASPATGSAESHRREQDTLLALACFTPDWPPQ